jgi:hypothetical protein
LVAAKRRSPKQLGFLRVMFEVKFPRVGIDPERFTEGRYCPNDRVLDVIAREIFHQVEEAIDWRTTD